MICFNCEKEILTTEKYMIIPLDKPYYVNLPFHREGCLPNDEKEYIEENWDRVKEWGDNPSPKKANKKRQGRKGK